MTQPNDAIRKELEYLTCRVLDLQLTADEDTRLTEILNTYPELIEDYTNQIHLDTLLSASLYESVPEGVSIAPQENLANENQATTGAAVVPNSRRSKFLLRGMGFAAVVLLVGFVIWMNDKQRPVQEEQIATRPDYVGILLDTEDAVWGNSNELEEIPYGTKFHAGQTLSLNSGIARIRFQCGAGVVLEGPAKIEFRSPLNALLHFGKLAAYVPDDVEGFSVDTSKIRIVDLGTRFGTVVGQSGEAEVHVFEGEVDVKPLETDKKIANLKARQGIRLQDTAAQNALGKVEPVKFADVPTREQLIAAKSGSYPPKQLIRFESNKPLNRLPLDIEKSIFPSGILVGDSFEYPATSLYRKAGGVGFAKEGWWVDQDFTRLIVPENKMGWGNIDGGQVLLHIRGRHRAYPTLAHRAARKIKTPLESGFYFSLLMQYSGLDDDDFFGLWFDQSMGGMGSSHSHVPSVGFKNGKFFARFSVEREVLFKRPVDDQTFFLVGHLYKEDSEFYNRLVFWVNPIGEQQNRPDVIVEQETGKPLKSVKALGVRIGQYTEVSDSLYLDRLVIGETYESVTTPTGSALLQQ